LRILFINISDIKGGSAIVAYRLAKCLEENFQTKNFFLVRNKFTNDQNVIQTRKNRVEEKVEWVANVFFNTLGLQYIFLPFSPKRILKVAKEFKPDIISLHNPIGGYFRIKDLIPLSKIAPIVWTLHDMWAITANAAHTFGNEHWKELKSGPGEWKIYPWIGLNTGKWLIRKKKEIYSKSNLSIIVPSTWMQGLVKQSPLLMGKKTYLIPHGLDLKTYKPAGRDKILNELEVPLDTKVVAFSAERLNRNPFKGGELLINILKKLDGKISFPVYFIRMGSGGPIPTSYFKNLIIKNVGYIKDQSKLIDYYSAADVFIYPSKADSFGLVLLESIACGTPCVTFDIGGCSDVILNDVSGQLITRFDTEKFAASVYQLLIDDKKLSELSNSCRRFAEEKFDIKNMAQSYYQIFSQLADK
jgi:glycosyltransferase involved in cell wall biosynthesis